MTTVLAHAALDGKHSRSGPRLVRMERPWVEPIVAFAPLAGLPHAVFLDSARAGDARARFSVIAAEPERLVAVEGGVVRVDGQPTRLSLVEALKSLLEGWRVDPEPLPLPGLYGFLGYEAGSLFERLATPLPADLGLADVIVGFYPAVAVFDHRERRHLLIAIGDDDGAASRAAEALAGRLGTHDLAPPSSAVGRWEPDDARRRVPTMVAETRDWIAAGDIYQANVTWRFLGERPQGLSSFDLYRRLRTLSPAPFAGFLGCGPGKAILSASPERFLELSPSGRIETRPIKGTRPRGRTESEDRTNAEALLASAKDRAENLMIVDLLRNDLSRVARIGTVRVPQLCGLETFPSVHHLVSVVEGRIAPPFDAIDLLAAAFPGGSITGAPKIRAMEIIRSLEPARRGPYCGTMLRIGVDGAMDSSILIRSLVVSGETVAAHAGGGIVWDSEPAVELEELLLKAAPLLAALDPGARP